ncbi:MAG: alpha/beta hydrolase [Lachnospiraceae bacterium]|nr:alpha/beta hydrolase [Lachnospiraceae bacterium]
MGNNVKFGMAEVNGIEMPYAKVCGGNGSSGKSLVILPGLSVKQVTPIAEAVGNLYQPFLDDGYSIYLFDRRTNAAGSYTVFDMAEDTSAVMKAISIEKADIFGASQGGMIAACIAITHPELVDHLMIGSSVARHNEYSDAIFRRWISLAMEKRERELAVDIGSATYSKASWDANGELIITANANVTDEEYARFIQMAEALLSFDFMGRLKETDCRTLIIGSEGDMVFPPEYVRETTEAFSCESFFYGAGYGHAVYDEAPDYIERLYAFCH